MQKKIVPRHCHSLISFRLQHNPAVALLGARQVGKSTLARQILDEHPNALYLDLESPRERQKITADPELFLQANSNRLICLDEIQFLPEIFQVLRSHIDQTGKNCQFLFLGSASRDLIRQSSETLAGRVAYIHITPFTIAEIPSAITAIDHWLKGGYPRSLLQDNLIESMDWRKDYIRTFLERDIPSLGFNLPQALLGRFWSMLAHLQGQLINFSSLAKSLAVSSPTIKNYLNILEQTFVVKILSPYFTNAKKRLVKSPKVYIRDTGILHTLLEITEINDLLGHPVVGASFETYIIENVSTLLPRWNVFFYRDSDGNEIDLVLQKGQKKIAVEIKCSTSPQVKKGFWNACKFLKPDQCFLIAQVDSSHPGEKGIIVTNLREFLQQMEERYP